VTWDCIIVGAGVNGLGIGWQVQRRGLSTLIVERGEPGCGASGAAAGMLAPISEAEAAEEAQLRDAQESLSMWPAFVEGLEAETGIAVNYRGEGTLQVAVLPKDRARLRHLAELYQRLGLEVEVLDGDQVRELEANLSPRITGGLYCPTDHQVDARKLVEALSSAFAKSGGVLRSQTEVVSVRVENGVLRGVTLADGTDIESRIVVVAAGAWSNRIGGECEVPRLSVRPVRGQMIAIELGSPPLCRHTLRSPDAYLVPKSDGRLLIGATVEEVGFDTRLSAGGVFELLRGAGEMMPAVLDQAIVEMWCGHRPVAHDNRPILRQSDIGNLWLATGHGRNGILLAPRTAYRLAEEILR
jgi:glycine oxidase